MTAFLIRCATWALLGWLATMHPAVPLHVRHATDEWRAAWKVESPACGPRATASSSAPPTATPKDSSAPR